MLSLSFSPSSLAAVDLKQLAQAQNETASLQVFNYDSTGSDMDLESEEETNEKAKAMVLSAQPPSPIHKEKAKAEQQKQKQNQGTERLKNLNQQLQQIQKQTKKFISHQSVNRNIDYKQFVIVNNDWKSFFSKSQNIMCWSSKSRKQCYPAAKRNFPELFNSGWVLLRPEQKIFPQNTTSKKKFYNVFTNVMCDDLSNEITNHLSAKSSLLYRSTQHPRYKYNSGTIVRPVMLCQHPVKGRTGCHGPSGKITKACKYCARIRGYK